MNQKSQNSNSIFAFSIAALVFSILSILCFCTGLVSMITGSLGLLFVCLSHRKDQPLPTLSIVAAIFSCIGIVIGTALTLYIMITMTLPMMTDSAVFDQYVELYRNMYGIDMREYIGDWSSLPKITY